MISISSTTGRIVVPFAAPYSATKFALEALVEEYAFELAPFGVESVIVEPGSFGTEAFGNLLLADDEAILDGSEKWPRCRCKTSSKWPGY